MLVTMYHKNSNVPGYCNVKGKCSINISPLQDVNYAGQRVAQAFFAARSGAGCMKPLGSLTLTISVGIAVARVTMEGALMEAPGEWSSGGFLSRASPSGRFFGEESIRTTWTWSSS